MSGYRLLSAEEISAGNGEVRVHAVDEYGYYLGLVMPGEGTRVYGPPPPVGAWRLQGGRWVQEPSLEEAKASALSQIDLKAGHVRLRFITDIPGQQATYMRKTEEARDYVEGVYSGLPTPPYLAAESAATGMSPRECAEAILATAKKWNESIGPYIENVRISGKKDVNSATTTAKVAVALANAISTLDAIAP